MSGLDKVLSLVQTLDDQEKLTLLRHLRETLPPHPMEERLKVTAEALLEAIRRASPLTIRGIEGILAEASFATEVLPFVRGWSELPSDPGDPFDFLLTDSSGHPPVRLQVKMQRRKNHQPWMASLVMKKTRSWPENHYVVEVQRTRGGEDNTGEQTRPYRFTDFDLLGVSLGASKGKWRHFMYAPARWLLPDDTDPKRILKYQPVSPVDDPDWTSDFLVAVERVRSGIVRTISG